VIIFNGPEDLLGISSKLLQVRPGEDIVKKINLSSILFVVKLVNFEAQLKG
jgi:hypothetical protein